MRCILILQHVHKQLVPQLLLGQDATDEVPLDVLEIKVVREEHEDLWGTYVDAHISQVCSDSDSITFAEDRGIDLYLQPQVQGVIENAAYTGASDRQCCTAALYAESCRRGVGMVQQRPGQALSGLHLE